MDDLLLLEGESIIDSPVKSLPAEDFTSSLDYIDSLPSRSLLSISRRDVANIATGLSSFDYLAPMFAVRPVPASREDREFRYSTDFRPVGDVRRWDPTELSLAPKALVRSASEVVADRVSPRFHFPPGWRNPLDPDRDVDDLNRSFSDIERRARRHPFNFRQPSKVVICLKRKIRRQILHASGVAGLVGFRPRRTNYWSRVIC